MAEKRVRGGAKARGGARAKAPSSSRATSAASVPDGRPGLIAALQEVRGRPLVAYVTSTRVGGEARMAEDAIRVIYDHLSGLELPEGKLDLFLHTDGGDATVPWRLMNLLREFASEVTLLVPHHAFSAGTLAALGADHVVMGPMGVLGPTDTKVTGKFNPHGSDGRPIPIEVEDVLSYLEWIKEDVGINHEEEILGALGHLADRVNPLALGLVKRSVLQSEMMGARLLGIRSEKLAKDLATEIVSTLGKKLFFHGHPINREEARQELKLGWVVDAAPAEEKAMWDLYLSYEEEMKLAEPFSPSAAALAAKGGKAPELPVRTEGKIEPPPTVYEVELDPEQLVWIESAARADCLEEEWTVTLSRSADGNVSSRNFLRSEAWVQKR